MLTKITVINLIAKKSWQLSQLWTSSVRWIWGKRHNKFRDKRRLRSSRKSRLIPSGHLSGRRQSLRNGCQLYPVSLSLVTVNTDKGNWKQSFPTSCCSSLCWIGNKESGLLVLASHYCWFRTFIQTKQIDLTIFIEKTFPQYRPHEKFIFVSYDRNWIRKRAQTVSLSFASIVIKYTEIQLYKSFFWLFINVNNNFKLSTNIPFSLHPA